MCFRESSQILCQNTNKKQYKNNNKRIMENTAMGKYYTFRVCCLQIIQIYHPISETKSLEGVGTMINMPYLSRSIFWAKVFIFHSIFSEKILTQCFFFWKKVCAYFSSINRLKRVFNARNYQGIAYFYFYTHLFPGKFFKR